MGMSQKITIDIDEQGNTTVSTDGFTGRECEEATAKIEAALGDTTANERTTEYFRAPLRRSRVRA